MKNATDRAVANEKIHRAKSAILQWNPKDSVAALIASDRDAFSGLRLLIASDHSGTPLQQHVEGDTSVISVFCGKGMFAFSDEIEQQMLRGEANVMFGMRALLDTNLLSDLPRFFTGGKLDSRDKVETALQFIQVNLDRKVDWTFASLENLREAAKPNNPWPFIKVAAVQHYEQVGVAINSAQDAPIGLAVFDQYMKEAEDHWRSWLGNVETWRQITRRDMIYAILLFTFRECWSGSSVEHGLSRLVDFCLAEFDKVPLKELYFGWKALQGMVDPKSRLAIFNEAPLRAPKKTESLDRISALAWDFFLFRWCETQMTELKGNTFFIPVVTSLDVDLVAAIQACPLRAILIDDNSQALQTVFADELEFQTCLENSITASARQKIEDPERRADGGEISRFRLSSVINLLEKEIQYLAASNR